MWRFYYQVTQTADAAVAQAQVNLTDGAIFFLMGIATTLIVLAPSYFEKRNK